MGYSDLENDAGKSSNRADTEKQHYLSEEYLLDDRHILSVHRIYFLRPFLICSALVAVIWFWRTRQLEHTIFASYEWRDFWNAAGAIFWEGGGLSVIVTALAFGVLWRFWRQFGIYLCATRPHPNKTPLIGKRDLRAIAAIHEPPGDIFTLVGVAFTFVGLALGLVTLSTDTIRQAVIGADDPSELGVMIVTSAVVFGSSLAVGLIASLNGIMLAVAARQLTAKFGMPVKSPADLSRDFEHMAKNIATMQVQLDAIAAEDAEVSDMIDRKLAAIIHKNGAEFEQAIRNELDSDDLSAGPESAEALEEKIRALSKIRTKVLRTIRAEFWKGREKPTQEKKSMVKAKSDGAGKRNAADEPTS
ncbi:MAG: hypothetical protein WDM91_10090 [Rhizomicrobium sp.]